MQNFIRYKQTKKPKWLVPLLIFLVLGYFFINPASKPYACTADAKFCIDGTYVGRDSNNNCKFYDCPQIIQCDAGNLCDIGECYKFLNEKLPDKTRSQIKKMIKARRS